MHQASGLGQEQEARLRQPLGDRSLQGWGDRELGEVSFGLARLEAPLSL